MFKKKKQGTQAIPSPCLSPRLRWIYTVLMCFIPILFFIVLEVGLRLVGFGAAYPLFIEKKHAPEYLLANPEVYKRYVTDELNTVKVNIDTVYFHTKKKPNSFRIFVQGGSSAAGFPIGRWASLAGMLEQRLQQTFPDRHIEVITTALSAVNSYTLLDFTDEIIEQKPDAVLIYAGHNEYLGIFGVASTLSLGDSRPMILAYLRLRDFRAFQLLQKTYTALHGLFTKKADQTHARRGTLMARIAGKKLIAYGSSIYDQGLHQFRANLGDLLYRYQKAEIPVFIGTLVSNERDQKPFISKVGPKTDISVWRRYYQAGLDELYREDTASATKAFEKAICLDDCPANAYYAQGQALEALGDYASARQSYLAAKDRDQLRFRAPEIFNQIIRDMAKRYNATVVEVQEAFVRASKDGIVGNDLMLEHVHPNIEGYFLIADTFYKAIRQRKLIGTWENAIPTEQAWKKIPITEVDRLIEQYSILALKADWPFRTKATKPDIPSPKSRIEEIASRLYYKRISWPKAMFELMNHYQKSHDYARAFKVAFLLTRSLPDWDEPYLNAGLMLSIQGNYKDAIPFLERAVKLTPNQPKILFALCNAYINTSEKGRAQLVLKKLFLIAPNHKITKSLSKTLNFSP